MLQPFWKGYYTEIDPEDPDQINQLIQNLTIDVIHFQENTIIGSGSHNINGNFSIEGTVEDNHASFKLKYPNKELIFQGQRENNVIEGGWGLDPQYDIGSFKFTYIVPKQGWNGRYTQGGIETQMDITNFTMENGIVKGGGSDQNGTFQINGTVNQADHTLIFTKLYQSGNDFVYWGTINNNAIHGYWGLYQNQPCGPFNFNFI